MFPTVNSLQFLCFFERHFGPTLLECKAEIKVFAEVSVMFNLK